MRLSVVVVLALATLAVVCTVAEATVLAEDLLLQGTQTQYAQAELLEANEWADFVQQTARAQADLDQAAAFVELDAEVEGELSTTPAKAPAKPATKPATKGKAGRTNLAARQPSTTPLAQRLTPAQHQAKWQEFKAANPKKKYKSAADEQKAFASFVANRAHIAQQNDAVATVLNPKPFNSAGPLADLTPAEFKAKYLRTFRPAKGQGQAKAAHRFLQVDASADMEAETEAQTEVDAEAAVDAELDAELDAEAAADAELDAEMEAETSDVPTTGAGHTAGKSGGSAGKSGGSAGKSGGSAGEAGGSAGKSGGSAGKSGGSAGKSGGSAGNAGGNQVVVAPKVGSNAPRIFEGYAFNNPSDKTAAQRICRVVATIWMKRYADNTLKRILNFGTMANALLKDPTQLCMHDWAGWVDFFHPAQAQIRDCFNELANHPSETQFVNPIISLSGSLVRDQAQCGSCWAQAAVGSVEVSLRRRGYSTLGAMSVQQVLDCATTANSHGCAGGTPMDAITYLKQAGSMTEDQYAYTGITGKCHAAATIYKPGGWKLATKTCDSGSCADQFQYETELLLNVKTDGPFIAYVDANNWANYAGGIFPPSLCSSTNEAGNHIVELIGYGQEDGVPYWLVKNSWEGFIRLAMGVNSCGIANFVGRAT